MTLEAEGDFSIKWPMDNYCKKATVIEYKNFNYDGQWYRDKMHGYGIMKNEQFEYEGQWNEGQMHGKGKIETKYCEKYEETGKMEFNTGKEQLFIIIKWSIQELLLMD